MRTMLLMQASAILKSRPDVDHTNAEVIALLANQLRGKCRELHVHVDPDSGNKYLLICGQNMKFGKVRIDENLISKTTFVVN